MVPSCSSSSRSASVSFWDLYSSLSVSTSEGWGGKRQSEEGHTSPIPDSTGNHSQTATGDRDAALQGHQPKGYLSVMGQAEHPHHLDTVDMMFKCFGTARSPQRVYNKGNIFTAPRTGSSADLCSDTPRLPGTQRLNTIISKLLSPQGTNLHSSQNIVPHM